ncbi:MAG: ATP-binding cassette domain-containing protein [Treponema sp.]|nr:ATP-binding cassette domain-containing protein [Treponema sp.]
MLLINKILLRMSRGVRGWIVLITLLRVLVLVGTAGFAGVVSSFLGNIADPRMGAGDFSRAVWAAFLNALIILVGELLIGEAEYRCTARARLSLREGIFSKLLELDVGNVEKLGGPGAAIASAADGVESMQLYYSKYLPGLCYCFCAPVYLFFRLKDVSFPAALFLLIVTLVLVPGNNLFRGLVNKLKDNYWTSFRNLTSYYLESLQNLTTIKLFNQDKRRTDFLETKARDFTDRIMDVMRTNFRSFLFSDSVIYVSVSIAVVIVCRQLLKGEITLSSALLVLMLGYGFFSSIRQLMNVTHQALAGIAAAQNISALLELDASRAVINRGEKAEEGNFDGIRMSHVSFSYSGRHNVVEDISLDFPRGKVSALVGRSGCGKSTIAGLLMRFFDPPGGASRIFFEGRDYQSFTPEELRRMISMVPQQVGIFGGTVEDNLRIAKADASQEELLEALSSARLKDWVLAQPEGLKTDVGDGGAKLSGGQRQKIGIARVLLSNAPYIIFDEATSGIDRESEDEIRACIADLSKTRSLILISHRLAAIRGADRIFVLAGGALAEAGRHEELMARRGLYYDLVREQEALERYGEGIRRNVEQNRIFRGAGEYGRVEQTAGGAE